MRTVLRENASSYRGVFYIIEDIIADVNTDIGNVLIFDNKELGRVLTIDHAVQLATVDEFIYHEMMAHTGMFSHAAPKRVIIIGGADGGILREVTKHSVTAIDVIDISDTVRSLCAEYIPEVASGAFEDERVRFVQAGGAEYVHKSDVGCDVIIVDGTDPGNAPSLYTDEFYADCERLLGDNGVLVAHCGREIFEASEVLKQIERLRAIFVHVEPFEVSVRYFPGASLVMLVATNGARDQSFDSNCISTRYFGPEMRQVSSEMCALKLQAFTRLQSKGF